jgi:ArsR family transcriptional regulator, cadmium/lead-responsive transcriptional repressor
LLSDAHRFVGGSSHRNVASFDLGRFSFTTGQLDDIARSAYHHDVAMIGEELGPAVALFHSLADRTRLAIVRRLALGEARVVDLTGELGLAQSTVSKHLACLRDCGLVDFRSEARQSFYSLTRPELIDLLAAAEGVLAATGEKVALCPVYGGPAQARVRAAAR